MAQRGVASAQALGEPVGALRQCARHPPSAGEALASSLARALWVSTREPAAAAKQAAHLRQNGLLREELAADARDEADHGEAAVDQLGGAAAWGQHLCRGTQMWWVRVRVVGERSQGPSMAGQPSGD